MKTNFLFKFIIITIITALQTYAMEDVVSQQIIKSGTQSALSADQHSYQTIAKDDDREKSVLFKTSNSDLVKAVITHAREVDKVKLNNTRPDVVHIAIDLQEQKHVQDDIEAIERDNIERAAIKNNSNGNCKVPGGAVCEMGFFTIVVLSIFIGAPTLAILCMTSTIC